MADGDIKDPMCARFAEARAAAEPRSIEDLEPLGSIELKRFEVEIPETTGERPEFDWVRVTDLRIQKAYQRGLSERGRRQIADIVAAFSWSKFGTISVSPVKDGRSTVYSVVDGQHRAIAAKSMSLRVVPAMVFDADLSSQADVFAGVNRDRISMDRAALYHAELLAGVPEIVKLEEVLARHGVKVLRTPKPGGPPPMATRAVGPMLTVVRRYGLEALEFAVKAISLTQRDTRGAFRGELLRALADAWSVDPEHGQRAALALRGADLVDLLASARANAKLAKAPVWACLRHELDGEEV
ncbi:MAG: ParB N-terminal domain-containing protein [Pseudomonadota bacterium]